MKLIHVKQSIIYFVGSLIVLFTTNWVLGHFLDFSPSKFILESFKVIIAIYFILLFFKFRNMFINIGVSLMAGAFVLQVFFVFQIPSVLKQILLIPILGCLFFGLGILLFGIYKLLQSNDETNDRLRKIALFDPLTHLPNRKFLFQECIYNDGKICDSCNSLCEFKRNVFKSDKAAILFVDIDDFKMFNDYAGHATGDRVLKIFAQRLREIAAPEDLVVRLSGDEFVLVYNFDKHKDHIDNFAKKLVEKMSEPIIIHGRDIIIHCSVGISIFPDHGSNMETLLKKADIAMYESKHYGKNQYYIFEDEMEHIFNLKFEAAHELRQAIKNKDFVVYYQKVANIQTSTITCLEALVRWKHPVKGVLPPRRFIPLAEEIQVIDEIDLFVLQTVAAQIKAWQADGKTPYPISVNISPMFFMRPDFLQIIQEIIGNYEINPQYLNLEITESVALRDFNRTKQLLEELKVIGIKIHIDNFGKGYSSFNYIREFQFDSIKIDKSFIDGIDNNTVDPALITLMTQLSKTLNFRIISEGVETTNQLEFLKEIGCDEYQGYILNRPRPIEELDLTFDHIDE